MPVKNNGPGALGRPAMTRKSKIDPEYPQWAESKMRAIENRRLKELRTVVRESMPEIMSIIAEEQETGPESIRHDGDSDMVRRIQNRFRIMRDRLSRRLKTDPLERDVRRCADYTDRRQLKEWQRSVRATLGIDIHDDFFLGERYDLMLKRWVEQNVSFITSIESSYFDDMESIVIEGFSKGRTPAAISADIQRRFGVTKSKANLLARDQVGTLSADLTRVRQQSAGVEEYIWSSSGDERVRATLGIDIHDDFFLGERYDLMLKRWVEQNVSFITSIESSYFDDMESIVIEGFSKGRTPAAISADIQRRFGVTKSKANLLARDQVGTLSADLTRVRQQSAGVEEYIWSSSGDERVRECHRELNGKKFRYDDPPAMWYMTKHGKVYSGRHCNPGEDYQCRCVAKPVFNFDRLNSAAFKERKP